MKLLHGDCLELMKDIPDGSVDLVLTDLPYGVLKNLKWDIPIDFEKMWPEIWRVCKPNAAVCLFGVEPFTSKLVLSQLRYFKYNWVWQKSPFNFLNASHQPLRNSENISVFYKKKPTYVPVEKDRISYKKHGIKHKKSSVLNDYKIFDKEHNGFAKPTTVITGLKKDDTRNIVHPTQKPQSILSYLIKTYTLEGETVLDFTMGSGSTGVAAKNLNRNFIGIELDENYYRIACDRIGD